MLVAPLILFHDELSEDDCHWYASPVARGVPVVLMADEPLAQKAVVVAVALPAVGVPVQAGGVTTAI